MSVVTPNDAMSAADFIEARKRFMLSVSAVSRNSGLYQYRRLLLFSKGLGSALSLSERQTLFAYFKSMGLA